MRPSRTIDVSTGLFVLLGLTAILFLVTQITNREFALGSHTYKLVGEFENVGGLKPGAPVSMAGVTIGRVTKIRYDMKQYKAVVVMRIDEQYNQIPKDSDASIYTSGLLGGQYVGISPGGAEEVFKNGDKFAMVQDAVVLENLISKYLFNKAEQSPPPAPAPADQPAAKE